MPDYSCDGEAQSVKPVHLHVTKTGQVQQIKITGARHAPLSPHVTEIVSVSACWRLDVIERDNIFSRPKIFFLTFLVRRLHPEPLGGHLAPFLHLDTDRYSTCTWLCTVMTLHLCVERLVLRLLRHELVPPVAQRGVALVSVLQSPLEIVTLTGTRLQCCNRT